ncbi:MAG: thiamine-phosphate kinase [Alphaproteobacteria bacterium]|nr:thiamine-phosphate kinase [Alphaproteobacteria bacterium]MBV9373078.1 thiamine-phosphate kinase [Alphaproteobacteria bacterium]MBV9899552.1 thiamine-phosphate kinase [Alphaproteobacteria bacterium]
MSAESELIRALRALAPSPAARGLADDAAVLEFGGRRLVLTHDLLVEGVHFLPADPPQDVAWKLVAVNLSDLAAKGARPLGVLLGYPLGGEEWDRAFVEGLAAALAAFRVALLGGDTVAAPRVLGLTAIGEAKGPVPSRGGARAGDDLWVSGTIGDAGAGLRGLKGELPQDGGLVERYRRPEPRLEAGEALAPLVSAMMDVSDGLLIDASRIAEASGIALAIELSDLPLSGRCRRAGGDDVPARLAAASAGDDYELLFTAAPERSEAIGAVAARLDLPLTRIGRATAGAGLALTQGGAPAALPARLGWEHGARPHGS